MSLSVELEKARRNEVSNDEDDLMPTRSFRFLSIRTEMSWASLAEAQ
jgi:hypothetical protein